MVIQNQISHQTKLFFLKFLLFIFFCTLSRGSHLISCQTHTHHSTHCSFHIPLKRYLFFHILRWKKYTCHCFGVLYPIFWLKLSIFFCLRNLDRFVYFLLAILHPFFFRYFSKKIPQVQKTKRMTLIIKYALSNSSKVSDLQCNAEDVCLFSLTQSLPFVFLR